MKDLREKFRLLDRLWYRLPKPRGRLGVRLLGYSGYVGGLWDEAGLAQFQFLCEQGLKPHHYLLDIGCGSLRGGVKFIPYLEAGHYMGIDQETLLIKLGLEKELGEILIAAKKPEFVVSSSFEFDQFQHAPDYAIAISLFTHLPEDMIHDCMIKLRKVIKTEGVFFASFKESLRPRLNPSKPHPHRGFQYTSSQMISFGEQTGWRGEPSVLLKPGVGQRLLKFVPN
jgi:hypothetical protein